MEFFCTPRLHIDGHRLNYFRIINVFYISFLFSTYLDQFFIIVFFLSDDDDDDDDDENVALSVKACVPVMVAALVALRFQ